MMVVFVFPTPDYIRLGSYVVSVLFFIISSYYYYQNFKISFKRINDARNFKKTFKGLEKTRKKVANAFSLISNKSYLDESDIELLEDCLSQADISYPIIENVVDALKVKDSSSINWKDRAHKVLLSKLAISQSADDIKKVIILVGINGSGKTTSAAKLAQYYSANGEKVCLVAGDTYRAAAVEQIETWSDRLNVRLVQNPNTTDPASVAFDGVESGMSRGEGLLWILQEDFILQQTL